MVSLVGNTELVRDDHGGPSWCNPLRGAGHDLSSEQHAFARMRGLRRAKGGSGGGGGATAWSAAPRIY